MEHKRAIDPCSDVTSYFLVFFSTHCVFSKITSYCLWGCGKHHPFKTFPATPKKVLRYCTVLEYWCTCVEDRAHLLNTFHRGFCFGVAGKAPCDASWVINTAYKKPSDLSCVWCLNTNVMKKWQACLYLYRTVRRARPLPVKNGLEPLKTPCWTKNISLKIRWNTV